MSIKIYTKQDCPYCLRTKQFLRDRNLTYDEKIVGVDITSEQFNRNYQTTVPAIFINENLIGGYDQLLMLATVSPQLLTNG